MSRPQSYRARLALAVGSLRSRLAFSVPEIEARIAWRNRMVRADVYESNHAGRYDYRAVLATYLPTVHG